MYLLATLAHPQIAHHRDAETHGDHLGRLVTPRAVHRMADSAAAGYPWAADNDCFQGLDPHAFVAMLDKVQGLPGCRWVTIPDVVGDAEATARQFDIWAPAVERRGLPVALVLQDGIENYQRWLAYQWHRLDAVFIGGTTEFKLGPVAAALTREAKAHGKTVHMGRVNTRRRVDYAASIGCDSFDGTAFCRWRKIKLPKGLTWAHDAQAAARMAGDQLNLTIEPALAGC